MEGEDWVAVPELSEEMAKEKEKTKTYILSLNSGLHNVQYSTVVIKNW